MLLDVANAHPAGMPMVLRFLVEGAVNSKFAALFGGKFRDGSKKNTSTLSQTRRVVRIINRVLVVLYPVNFAKAIDAVSHVIQGRSPGQTIDLVDFDLITLTLSPILLGQIWQNWHSNRITYRNFENQCHQEGLT